MLFCEMITYGRGNKLLDFSAAISNPQGIEGKCTTESRCSC
uniref:Uncharacterized protein n=1 Tax=Anguilla anguilla TaxID=7936 RepID=A0A0E9TP21_ANGAN